MSVLHIRIRELRLARGWTQRELANAAQTNRSTIGALESDKRVPNLTVLDRVAKVLGLSVAELIVVESRAVLPKAPALPARIATDALRQRSLEDAIELLTRAGYRVIPPPRNVIVKEPAKRAKR